MQPSLVVLAAGLARRFGGVKQLEPVGPDGEILLDYAIHDALRAAFGRIIVILRRGIEAAFGEHARRAWRGLPVTFVLQEQGAPAGGAAREKPWGTAAAVLAARQAVREPFAVMNADDFYGRRSIALLADCLSKGGDPLEFALVAYRLGATLSSQGGVSRAICVTEERGLLMAITEYQDVSGVAGGITGLRGGQRCNLDASAAVSMNLWGFTPAVFPLLAHAFARFLEAHGSDAAAELALPDAVAGMVSRREARVRVLPGPDEWLGITYASDAAAVSARLGQMTAAGLYPRPLAANQSAG